MQSPRILKAYSSLNRVFRRLCALHLSLIRSAVDPTFLNHPLPLTALGFVRTFSYQPSKARAALTRNCWLHSLHSNWAFGSHSDYSNTLYRLCIIFALAHSVVSHSFILTGAITLLRHKRHVSIVTSSHKRPLDHCHIGPLSTPQTYESPRIKF